MGPAKEWIVSAPKRKRASGEAAFATERRKDNTEESSFASDSIRVRQCDSHKHHANSRVNIPKGIFMPHISVLLNV
jgi:hypothetical protein